jgi:pimeloyl-ACP methyl ester carboxylesterase
MIVKEWTGITYDDRGAGEPALLFLPGWCGPRTLFDPLAARLDDRCRILTLDWRGHGESNPVGEDFGSPELADDAIAILDDSGVDAVVPVAAAHAGWIAIELRRRLGPRRVPRLVFLDWMVLGAPAHFGDALEAMMDRASTRSVVDQITTAWVGGRHIPALESYVASMAASPDAMWARAAREIARAFEADGTPLDAVAALDPPPPTLHLYAQPSDPDYLDAQRAFAASHPWFQVARLDAASHFPVFEVADDIAEQLHDFVAHVEAPTR